MYLDAEILERGEVVTAEVFLVGIKPEDRKSVGIVKLFNNYLNKLTTLGTVKEWGDERYNKWARRTFDFEETLANTIDAVQVAFDRSR